MSVKEAVRGIAPKSVLEDRRHRSVLRVEAEHRCMSREEGERWLKARYLNSIGAELDLENPRRYTEKIQWCKLHAMDKRKSLLADKWAVRGWVADKIGPEYLVPSIGVWDDPGDIDFDSLPQAFALKTNNASGTNIIVPHKSKLDVQDAKRKLRHWLEEDFGWRSFESQYLAISPKIVGERFLANPDGREVPDYKFLCFDGEPRFIWVDLERHSNHTRIVLDTEWSVQPWNQYHYPEAPYVPQKPAALQELLDLTRALASGFAQVRVDFYVVNNRPLFGEMTFTNGAGFEEIRPDEWDYRLGDMWDLSKEPRCELPWRRS